MKTLKLFCATVLCLLLASCGDSHESLVKDKLSYMEEYTEILEDISAGNISSNDAVVKINAWGKKGNDLMEREQKLFKDLSMEEKVTLHESLSPELIKRAGVKAQKFAKAMEKAISSGNLTPAIQDAMANVKNH